MDTYKLKNSIANTYCIYYFASNKTKPLHHHELSMLLILTKAMLLIKVVIFVLNSMIFLISTMFIDDASYKEKEYSYYKTKLGAKAMN